MFTGDLKPILMKLISPGAAGLRPGKAPRTRDYIDSLIKINSLLGQDNRKRKPRFSSCHWYPETRIMDKVIVTVLLIIGGVVAAFAIFNGVYPALERSSSAINSRHQIRSDDQIKSQIEIINVSSKDPPSRSGSRMLALRPSLPVENSDVFIITMESLLNA